MKKTKFSIIAILLCLALSLGACAGSPAETPNKPASNVNTEKDATQSKLDVLRPTAYSSVNGLTLEPGSYISIIGRYSADNYWKEVEAGAKKAIEDLNSVLGYKGNDKIKLTYSAPVVKDDVNEQVNILDEELARYPIAIGIAPIDTTACTIQFDLAAENGTQIITFDSGSDYQKVGAHVSTDDLTATKTAATQLAYAIEESGEVAVFVQDSISRTSKQRLQAFSDTIAANFPNVSVVSVYHMDELETMRQTIAAEKNATLAGDEKVVLPESISQKDVIAYILEKNPNLKGVYATSLDTIELVASVLSETKKTDLKFIGYDGGKEQIALLKSGILDGLVVQNPFAMGYATVVAAIRVALGLGNESFVDSGYTYVTPENMSEKEILKMLY